MNFWKEIKRKKMWIMKITPSDPHKTEYYFKELFCKENCPNVIGYYKDSGKIEEFKDRFDSMSIGDVVVVIQGFQRVVGCVVVTSDSYDEDPENDHSPDWFLHRRKAELLLKFNPPYDSVKATNRDTIIDYSGEGAKSICDEVWGKVKGDYNNFINEKAEQFELEIMKEKIRILEYKYQIILQGPPGTGKTRLAKDIAYNLIFNSLPSTDEDIRKVELNQLDNSEQFKLIQFHPAYSYEDFVRGISAKSNGNNIEYKTEDKVLAEFARKALENCNKGGERQKYVLVIDEINRANLPAVLGELIYALEYRNVAVESMYGKGIDNDRKITLPYNLYIIGTMNTADRSVGHIDYAIRRRFAFIDVPADISVLEDEKAKKLFNQVADLFNKKSDDGTSLYLASDFKAKDVQLGHSYFLGSEEILKLKLQYEIKPILQEYLKDGILLENSETVINDLHV